MYPITERIQLSETTVLLRIRAPRIAAAAKPGQFVMVRIAEQGERIPLTIADNSEDEITLVFLVVGRTTTELSKLRTGDAIRDVAGPLGNPLEVRQYGTVAFVAGGLGIAAVYPQLRALQPHNRIIAILGARTREQLFFTDAVAMHADRMVLCTEDGSIGMRGRVTEALERIMVHEAVNRVIAIGPTAMMKAVAELTRPHAIPTFASINTIMVDGIGMCGSCRITVDGQVRFACVDGPEFDAHAVNWDELLCRNALYRDEEQQCSCRGKG